MSEFNERTALNYKLRQDALTTKHRATMARQRMEYRHRRAACRKSVTIVAVNATLAGAALTAGAATLGCLISLVL